MNKLILIAIAAVSAVSSSRIAAATPSKFYTGASAGYFLDSEDSFYGAKLGVVVSEKSTLVQSIEVEVGYTSDEESMIELSIKPIMVNYRASLPVAKNTCVYLGGGLGSSYVEISSPWVSITDYAWTYQGLAGVEYKATPKLSVTAGVRYVWIGDVDVYGSSVRVGDDTAIEAGISYRF